MIIFFILLIIIGLIVYLFATGVLFDWFDNTIDLVGRLLEWCIDTFCNICEWVADKFFDCLEFLFEFADKCFDFFIRYLDKCFEIFWEFLEFILTKLANLERYCFDCTDKLFEKIALCIDNIDGSFYYIFYEDKPYCKRYVRKLLNKLKEIKFVS